MPKASKKCSRLSEVVSSSSVDVTQCKLTLFPGISGFFIQFLLLIMCFTDHQQNTKCPGEEDREREEKKQRMSKLAVLNYCTVLPRPTCASRHKNRAFWSHWCHLLASTKPSETNQRLRTWNLWMKCSVCVQWEVAQTQENTLDRPSLSGWDCICSPSPPLALKWSTRFTFPSAGQAPVPLTTH